VLFIYARGGGTTMVSGKGTPAAAMLTLAGAESAITAWDGFRPLTAEAVVEAAPDVVLLPSRGLDCAGRHRRRARAARPGGDPRPARRGGSIALDDQLLLGFGPRLPAAIDELARALAAP
jgi:iron complex transport system substrate-binding protein